MYICRLHVTMSCVSEIQYLFCRYSSHRVSGIADTAPPKYLMCIQVSMRWLRHRCLDIHI